MSKEQENGTVENGNAKVVSFSLENVTKQNGIPVIRLSITGKPAADVKRTSKGMAISFYGGFIPVENLEEFKTAIDAGIALAETDLPALPEKQQAAAKSGKSASADGKILDAILSGKITAEQAQAMREILK